MVWRWQIIFLYTWHCTSNWKKLLQSIWGEQISDSHLPVQVLAEMRTPLITCEQWIAFLIWIAISDECVYSSFITPKTVGFVRLCDKIWSLHTQRSTEEQQWVGEPQRYPAQGISRDITGEPTAYLPTEEAERHSTSRAPQ